MKDESVIENAVALGGILESLSTKGGTKGVKGVVSDTAGKVSASLSPAEQTRYETIFKIAKSVMDPKPEAGSIDPSEPQTQPPEIEKVPMAGQGEAEKEDPGLLGMLMSILPLLPLLTPLLGPLLIAAAGGLGAYFKKEIKEWINDTLITPIKSMVGGVAEIGNRSQEELTNALSKMNQAQDKITDRLMAGEKRLRVMELEDIIDDPRIGFDSRKRKRAIAELEKIERQAMTQEEKQMEIENMVNAIVKNQNALSVLESRHGKRFTDLVEEANRGTGPTSLVEVVAHGLNILPDSLQPLYLREANKRVDNTGKIRIAEQHDKRMRNELENLLLMEHEALIDLVDDDAAKLQELRKDTTYSALIQSIIESNSFQERINSMFQEQITKDTFGEFYDPDRHRSEKIEDGIVFQNGRSTRIDSEDSIIAAKIGGPIEKMLDQNSAVQTEQLDVLKEVRDGIKKLVRGQQFQVRRASNTSVSYTPSMLMKDFNIASV